MMWFASISTIVFCYFLISFLFPNTHDLTSLGLTSIQLNQRKQAKAEVKAAATPQERKEILLRWLKTAENLGQNKGFGVDPWCYMRLAGIYQKEDNYAEELKVLQRFKNRPHTTNLVAEPLMIRMQVARAMAAKRGKNRVEDEIDDRESATGS
jgi:hypothetical protein